MASLWGPIGIAANVAQLAGLDAVRLIALIVQAAANARMHKTKCNAFSVYVQIVCAFIEPLNQSEFTDATRKTLKGLEDALRRSYLLVKSCEDRSFPYLLIMGWKIERQFRTAEGEIDLYLKLIPLINFAEYQKLKRKEKKGNGEKKSHGEKKGEGSTVVEVKLDLHCERCAHKVEEFVGGLQGVESAKLDVATNRLKVSCGKVDPSLIKKLLENENETKREVEFISPKDPPTKSKDEGKKKKADAGKDKEPKKEEAKLKPPEEKKSDGKKKGEGSNVVEVKLDLHCERCAHKVKEFVGGLQGVESAKLDEATKKLKVSCGKVDPSLIKELLENKIKGEVKLISPKDPPNFFYFLFFIFIFLIYNGYLGSGRGLCLALISLLIGAVVDEDKKNKAKDGKDKEPK